MRRNDTWWYRLRYRLAYWIHPDTRFWNGKLLPENGDARYIIELISLHGDKMPEDMRQRYVTELRDWLGIKPQLTRKLPYLGD